MLGIASGSIPMSQLAGQVGFIHMGYICTVTVTILYGASYFANNFYLLLLLRFLIGFNVSAFQNIRNTVMSVYPPIEERIYNVSA